MDADGDDLDLLRLGLAGVGEGEDGASISFSSAHRKLLMPSTPASWTLYHPCFLSTTEPGVLRVLVRERREWVVGGVKSY